MHQYHQFKVKKNTCLIVNFRFNKANTFIRNIIMRLTCADTTLLNRDGLMVFPVFIAASGQRTSVVPARIELASKV